MAKKQTNTTLLEKEQRSFFDIIDEKLDKQSKVELEAKKALFNNNHKTEELEEVYDEIDKKQVEEQLEHLEHKVAPIDFENPNPFYGDPDALNKLKKHKYKNTVFDEQEKIATIEINPPAPAKVKEVDNSKRKILWTCVGAITIVLFLTLFIYNFVIMGSTILDNNGIQGDINNAQDDLISNQERYEQILNELGESSISIAQGEGMITGGSSTTVNLEPTTEVYKPTAPSGFFDRLCNFFAKLFGR